MLYTLSLPCLIYHALRYCTLFITRLIMLSWSLSPTCVDSLARCTLKEKFGLFVDFQFLTEMGCWGADQSIPVGLRKILHRKVIENGVRKKKKRPCTGISRGNDRDAICAFKFAPSGHAFDLHTFLRLIRTLCRSLVVEGSVLCGRCCFRNNSPSKRICRGTLSQKTGN